MHFNPPTPGNNSANPFWHPLNQRMNPQPVQEAVTVELEFKKDADGKKAGGKKVRDKVYKMTFKNDAEMNKFMDKNANMLDEGTEQVDESTPAYRKMMKDYEGSDMKKVFDILKPKGFRVGEQDDTLVRNMLKKHKNDVKKAAAEIEKKYSNRFESVELDEISEVEIPAEVKKIAKELDDAVALHSSQAKRLKDARIENNEDMPKEVRDIPKELDKAVAMHKTQADRLRKAGISESEQLDDLLSIAEEFGSQYGKAAEAAAKRGSKDDKDGDHIIISGTLGAGKPAYASSIDRVHNTVLRVHSDKTKAVRVNKKTADKLVKSSKHIKAEKVD